MNRKVLGWLGPLLLLAVVVGGVWYFVFRESSTERVGRLMTEAARARELYEYKKAEQLILEAIDISPESPLLYNALAVIYVTQERLEDARSAFARAAFLCGPQANEVRADMYGKVADLDVKLSRYSDAESALEMAIASHPTRRDLHTRLIDVQVGFLENPARADSSTRRFLRLCSPTPQNYYDAARLYFARKAWLRAAELARQAAARADTMIAAHALVGTAYWRAGYPDTGLTYLEGPLQRYPEEVELWVTRASLEIGAQRPEAALQTLSRALELAPDSYTAHRARMMALYNAKRYEESLAESEVCYGLTDSEDERRFLRMHSNRVRDILQGRSPESGHPAEGGTKP